MSQSPLSRSTGPRKSLSAFSHAPSRLRTQATSTNDDDDTTTYLTPSSSSTNLSANSYGGGNGALSAYATPPRQLHTPRRSGLGGTPRITYSPYATSTPPAGLSKSTSIPFDMAASAKAARHGTPLAGVGSQRAETPSAGPKKRFVRRKPFWKRIIEAPRNYIDHAVFNMPTEISDILPPSHLARPIALGIYAVQFIACAPLSRRQDRPSTGGPADRWSQYDEVKTTVLGTKLNILLTVILLMFTAANAAYLFTRFRTYDMQLRSAQDPVSSPHASPISKPTAETSHEPPAEEPETALSRIIAACKWIVSAMKKPTPADDTIQSLRVWEPPEFCLAFFCALPPSAPLLTHLLTPRHPFVTLAMHLITALLLSHLAASFAQLVKDRMLLAAEVMKEYDQRFVYKRVFASRVDRGVGTHEAESLW